MCYALENARPWPEDGRAYVDAAQVARKLGYASLKAFYRHKAWREARGFPDQPLPRRWRASQIERWEAARIEREAWATPQAANDTGPDTGDPTPSTARERMARLRARMEASA